MRERLNRADSKSVELHCSSEGSNPSLSDPDTENGEMSERPKEYAWKAYVPYPGTWGSNPHLSVFLQFARALRNWPSPNPVRTGR